MKWGVVCLPLVLAVGGCASVSEINETLPTMSVISGKKPHEYAQCLADKLAGNFLRVQPQCLISKIAPAAAASSCMSACRTCRFARVTCKRPPMRVFPADRLTVISTDAVAVML